MGIFFSDETTKKIKRINDAVDEALGYKSKENALSDGDIYIRGRLENLLGTADLDYVLKVGKKCKGMNQYDMLVRGELERSFGTADLDYIFKRFAPKTYQMLLQAQKNGSPLR